MTDSLDGTSGVEDHYTREVTVPPGASTEAVFQGLAEQLLRYNVFPPGIIRGIVCSEDGRVHEGATIIQRFSLGPIRLEAGVRVARVWHEQDETGEEIGFTYVTVRGHPERGVETFRLRRTAHSINFTIDARSGAGTLLTRLGRPLARVVQRRATLAALERFATLPHSESWTEPALLC